MIRFKSIGLSHFEGKSKNVLFRIFYSARKDMYYLTANHAKDYTRFDSREENLFFNDLEDAKKHCETFNHLKLS